MFSKVILGKGEIMHKEGQVKPWLARLWTPSPFGDGLAQVGPWRSFKEESAATAYVQGEAGKGVHHE